MISNPAILEEVSGGVHSSGMEGGSRLERGHLFGAVLRGYAGGGAPRAEEMKIRPARFSFACWEAERIKRDEA
ncbi:hypothetical protein ACLBWT_06355 [Paenibacillus sp. D51F]